MSQSTDEIWKNIIAGTGFELRTGISNIHGWSQLLKRFLDQLKQDGVSLELRELSLNADEAVDNILNSVELLRGLEARLREELRKPHSDA